MAIRVACSVYLLIERGGYILYKNSPLYAIGVLAGANSSLM